MAQLPISSSQSQTTTQSPQASAQSLGGTTQSSSVQPGTTTALLNSGSGSVALHPMPLTSVSLSTAQPTTDQTVATAAKPAHHTDPVFFGLAVVLFAAAALLYWLAGRAEQSNLH